MQALVRLFMVGVVWSALTASCCATAAGNESPQQNGAPFENVAPAPSILQVGGTPSRVTISANRADVRSVLKLLFDQVHRQFIPDSSVAGEVTMSLQDQPFNVVLNAVCQQTFLRYTVETNTGIFHFTQNLDAVKNAISRMNAMNGLIRNQLQNFGYTVPSTPLMNNNAGVNRQPGNGFGGGGFGRAAAKSTRSLNAADKPLPGSVTDFAAGSGARSADGRATSLNPENRAKDNNDGNPSTSQSRAAQEQAGENRRYNLGLDQQADAPQNVQPLLNQNGLVTIHVAPDQPIPVTELLQEFGKQASVPILIDPNVPKGKAFRVSGNITRPLPEALNYLTLAAHLEWRYVGNSIFVTTSPDFQIFVGDMLTPRAIYPPPTQRSVSQQRLSLPQQKGPLSPQKSTPHRKE